MRKHLTEDDPPRRRQLPRRWAAKLFLVVLSIALLGGVGHQVLDRLRQVLPHHLFHILFPGGAILAFAAYAIADARRYGRPSFSWRLR